MSKLSSDSMRARVLIAATILAALLTVVAAQQSAGTGPSEHARIERIGLVLTDPQTYQVSMRLEPVTSLRLVARVDGVVENVQVETDEKLAAQEEVVRLESGIRQIELERAQAAFQLARLKRDAAGEGTSAELLAARFAVAAVDLQIAEQRMDDTIVRAPFAGTITEVHVTPGQFVRAGDPLVTLADLTLLTVDVPVSRNDVSEGDLIEVRVEERTVSGEVTRILPLSEQFEPLRDLFLSIATARVTLDGAEFERGQAVSSDMIPRQPVVEVPTAALRNTDDGQRKVQVVREEYVRDVIVQLHGQNGEEHVFVSGRLEPADELVVNSSADLIDGTRVVPAASSELVRPATRRTDDDE